MQPIPKLLIYFGTNQTLTKVSFTKHRQLGRRLHGTEIVALSKLQTATLFRPRVEILPLSVVC